MRRSLSPPSLDAVSALVSLWTALDSLRLVSGDETTSLEPFIVTPCWKNGLWIFIHFLVSSHAAVALSPEKSGLERAEDIVIQSLKGK